ncbi:kinase-like protein [Choiromyces venosus 120613-1]|uniref:Kinase-like protein n=1 Tax=Choiromyces venosus 120613-1 TaxID=1336337 RepID=A0A3N4K5J6_9PEZI|nr:kinase-like protein [Choiromyces venosus 120613-1]
MLKVFLRKDLLVGRDPNKCSILLEDITVSRQHIRIYSVVFEDKSEPLVYCEDVSRSGSLLNGKPTGAHSSVLLSHGDVISLDKHNYFCFIQPTPLTAQRHIFDRIFERERTRLTPDHMITDRVLGKGAYGRVHLAWDLVNHKQVACKVVGYGPNLAQGTPRKARDLHMREFNIMASLNHPNILALHRVIRTEHNIYMFSDLITGGDLFSRLDSGPMTEIETLPVVYQLLKALEYMHKHGVVHRDLKPDNILCTRHANGSRIVLGDFGSARLFTPGTRLQSQCGTLEYLAPELITPHLVPSARGYTSAIDYWALGAIVYTLLTNTTPIVESLDRIPTKLQDFELTRLEDNKREWVNISPEAKDFIRRLMTVDPRNRMASDEAQCHVWLARHMEELEDLYGRATKEWEPLDRTDFKVEEKIIDGSAVPFHNLPDNFRCSIGQLPDFLFEGSLSSDELTAEPGEFEQT